MADEADHVVEFINTVWNGGITADRSQITSKVTGTANSVFLEIQKCSEGFGNVNVLFGPFYKATSIVGLITGIIGGAIQATIKEWITGLRSDVRYNACVVTAAAKWRTEMLYALWDLYNAPADEIVRCLKEHGITDEREILDIMTRMKK